MDGHSPFTFRVVTPASGRKKTLPRFYETIPVGTFTILCNRELSGFSEPEGYLVNNANEERISELSGVINDAHDAPLAIVTVTDRALTK